MSKKQIPPKKNEKISKRVVSNPTSTDCEKVIWCFGKLERNGIFKFDPSTDESFLHKDVLCKIIDYGNMTWSEIKKQTHDKKNKSKHHYLEYDKLSKEAQDSIQAKKLEEEIDGLFSFAFNNKLRIIGIRDNAKFHIVWYDSCHKFCPTSK